MKAFLKLSRYIRVLLFVFTYLTYKSANAQYSIAGSTVGIYTDISDTLLCYGNVPYSYSLSLDINQDGTNDIKILSLANGYPVPGGYGVTIYTDVASLNNYLSLCLWKNICSNIGKLLFPFNIGDTISGHNSYISGGYMSYSDSYYYNCSNYEWMNNTDHYIGVRYATNIDTAYGWIGVRITTCNSGDHAVIVKSFALEKNPLVGLHELSANNLRVTTYPNPAQMQLYIKSDEAEIKEIKILNVTGSEVVNTTRSPIDVSSLPNGIYFAQVKTDKGVGMRKIVVQR